jgi:glutathione synthase/RimK-type ligase-like ATP-grasp enzyme
VTNGGKMERFSPSKAFIDMAIEACKTVKADFAGVDILFGESGEPVLCEINSNAHFRNLYDATGINVADDLADYVLRKARG